MSGDTKNASTAAIVVGIAQDISHLFLGMDISY